MTFSCLSGTVLQGPVKLAAEAIRPSEAEASPAETSNGALAAPEPDSPAMSTKGAAGRRSGRGDKAGSAPKSTAARGKAEVENGRGRPRQPPKLKGLRDEIDEW
jgi:hypothetical protein